MFPLCILVTMLCLQCGGLCNAIHIVPTVNLQVEYGESAILPCNGSAYLEEERSVQWEAMGEDVAILQGGELIHGDKFKGRVQLPSEEKLREGDWSVVLQHTMLSDTDMYECIWQGRKTISTVWLTVTAPHVEPSLVVPAGDMAHLACYIQTSRSQSPNDLQVWWTRNGSTIVSTDKEALFSTAVVSNSEDMSRMNLLVDTKEAFHLYMSPTMMSDNGEYRCLYKTRDSDDPRPGIPESIALTVLETNPTDIVFHPDETTTGTDDWVSTSYFHIMPWIEEVTETTDSPFDLLPVLLEDSTQPIKVMTDSQPMEAVEEMVTSFPDEVMTESQPMEAVEEMVTSFPDEVMTESQPMEAVEEMVTSFPDEVPTPPIFQDSPETESESVQWDTLPWIRIGLIAGVLLVTVVVLCILGALRKI